MNILRETGLDHWRSQAWMVRQQVSKAEVPVGEGWRIQYLAKQLKARKEMETKCQDVPRTSTEQQCTTQVRKKTN